MIVGRLRRERSGNIEWLPLKDGGLKVSNKNFCETNLRIFFGLGGRAHRPFSESRVMYTSVYQALFRNGTTVEWQPGILSVHAYEFDYDQSTCVRAATEENMPGRKKPWPFTIDHTFIIIFEYNSTVRAGPESRSCVVPPPRPALFPHQVPSPADIGNQSNSRNVFFSCVVALKAFLRRAAE